MERLDAQGRPLEIGREYTLVTYGENGITPSPSSEWRRAVWDGSSLTDKEGCTWNEWLEPAGKRSEDVLP